MKIANGATEGGIVIGNTYDKYHARNPIVRWMMSGFQRQLDTLVRRAAPRTINEIGCGEGYLTLRWQRAGLTARGSDFSSQIIDIAKQNAREQGISDNIFQVRSIYDLSKEDAAELLVCCEVLEHLEHPREALSRLQSLPCGHLIFSVPCEPLWRILNLTRFKYVGDLGNTPGHIQHWSRDSFVRLVSEFFDVVAVHSPFPWTMLLCRPKRQA